MRTLLNLLSEVPFPTKLWRSCNRAKYRRHRNSYQNQRDIINYRIAANAAIWTGYSNVDIKKYDSQEYVVFETIMETQ
ncbi:MAG: hypothetical protein GX639_07730 [Fibrobacter sp.]|nr:hypothetical protein [Fibrobacter sp.]